MVVRAGLGHAPPAAPLPRCTSGPGTQPFLTHYTFSFLLCLPCRASVCCSPGYSPQNRKQSDMAEPLGLYTQPINNTVVVLGEQRRDSAVRIHGSILPQTLLPSRLAHIT